MLVGGGAALLGQQKLVPEEAAKLAGDERLAEGRLAGFFVGEFLGTTLKRFLAKVRHFLFPGLRYALVHERDVFLLLFQER